VKTRILVLVALTATTTGIARIVASQTPDPLDPIRAAAASHKLAFENHFVRVLEVHHRVAGTFAWSEATVHTVENVGRTDGHILRIELKF